MPSTSHKETSRRSGLRRIISSLSFAAVVTFLTTTFALQVVLLVADSWEVPAPLLTRLHEKLETEGWKMSYERIGFRFPARVIVVQPKLNRNGESESLAEAEVAQIDFSFLKLLQGELLMRRATLYGGAVFCPAILSLSGKRESVLENMHGVIEQSADSWQIENLNAQVHNLAISASGVIPILPEKDGPPMDWNVVLAEVLPRIFQERETLERAQQPHVRVTFIPGDDGTLGFEAEGWANQFHAPEHVEIAHPRLKASGSFDGMSWMGEYVSFNAAHVSWDSRVSAHRVSAKANWASPEARANPLPDVADISIAEVEGPAETWHDLRAQIVLTVANEIDLDLFAFFRDEPLEGTAQLDWRNGNGRLDLISRLNPTALFRSKIARSFNLPFEIDFSESPFARASAWLEDWKFVRAFGRAHARQTNIDGAFFQQATARAELLPDRFIVPEMNLSYEDFAAHGSYAVDFESRAYRLLFAGDVRPLHIQAWFRDWWTGLWNRFEFPNEPLRGDVDIHGVHGQSEKVRLFGSVEAEDFLLSDVPIQLFDSRLFVSDNFVHLFDTGIRRPEGGATGWFQFHTKPNGGGMGRLDFEAHSTLDPVEIAPIFGEGGKKLFSSFQFAEPPALLLGGTVYGAPRKDDSRVTVTGRSSAPLEYYGLALDRLLVDLLLEGSDWSLRQIDAGLAGGEVTGDARKWEEDGKEWLGFSLVMLDIELPRGLQAISTWRAGMGLEGANRTPPENIGGVVDMSLQAAGLFGDFESFSGRGRIQIRDANLAEVHLLGLLSRILSATPLGFTSLQFTEAEAQFLLNLEDIHFPSLRLTGPTSEIQASGDYNLKNDALDFSLKLHMMRKSKIPFLSLLLSPVLEPLAHVLEIHLTGPISDPEWRFLLGPSNILSGITGEGSDEGSTDEN